MLSRACQYGILLLVHLAHGEGGRFEPVHEAAAGLGLSAHFLAKTVGPLARAGLVKSYRGPNGGVALARDPMQIHVRDVVRAIDGSTPVECCVLGLPGCGENRPCPMHDAWSAVRANVSRLLDDTTVGALAARLDTESLRLSSLDPEH